MSPSSLESPSQRRWLAVLALAAVAASFFFTVQGCLVATAFVAWIAARCEAIARGDRAAGPPINVAFGATLLQIGLAFLTAYFGLVDGRRFLAWLAVRDTLGTAIEGRLVSSIHDTTVSSVVAWYRLSGRPIDCRHSPDE